MTITINAPEATLLEQYVAAVKHKNALQAQAKQASEDARELEAALLEEFARENVRAKVTPDGSNVHIIRKVYARPAGGVANRPVAAAALKAAGLDDFVHEDFNVNSLSALFREEIKRRESEGQPVTDLDVLLADMYPPLVGAIALTDDHKLGVSAA